MKHSPKEPSPAPTTSPSAPAAEASAPLTTEQIETLKAEAAKAAHNWDHYVRALADLENYRKRAARERTEAIAYANQSLLQKLLPILDNFEMALAATQTNATADNIKSLADGIAMIQTQLKATLTEAGLEEIDATGKPFDPNFHEALSEQESAEVPDHHVLQQLRRGYKLRDRLLRPATVIIAKAPAPK
jgi:molecular chaperone GrpE